MILYLKSPDLTFHRTNFFIPELFSRDPKLPRAREAIDTVSNSVVEVGEESIDFNTTPEALDEGKKDYFEGRKSGHSVVLVEVPVQIQVVCENWLNVETLSLQSCW